MQVTSGIQCNLLSPSYSTIYAPQGDAKSRFVLIQLLEGAAPWEVPAGASVIIRAAKPDGTICMYDTNEAGESASSVSGSTVTIELVGQVLTAPGPVLMQIDFYNADGAHLSTFTFCCQVSESVVADDDIVSSDYFSVLTATLTEMLQIEQAVKAAYGAPLVAATAASMTDHTRVYVYTGSESGYTNGNWYYWNGTAWASGGVYNSSAVNVDSAPTQGSTNPVSSGGTYTAIANEAAAREAADTALSNEVDDVKSALHSDETLLYTTGADVTVTQVAQGWKLNDSRDGLCSQNADYKLVKCNVTAGETYYVVTSDLFQFQSAGNVPSSGTPTRIGDTYGDAIRFVTAPEGATILVGHRETEITDDQDLLTFLEVFQNAGLSHHNIIVSWDVLVSPPLVLRHAEGDELDGPVVLDGGLEFRICGQVSQNDNLCHCTFCFKVEHLCYPGGEPSPTHGR